MKFQDDFRDDIQEAYEYWCSKQEKLPQGMTVEKWTTGILQKPVYELIGAKRTENG